MTETLDVTTSGFDYFAEREYLITNGIGGYSSSSLCGMNTRRYHGILIASHDPPTQREVLISKVEETVTIGDQVYELSTNQYPDNIHPHGYTYITSFQRDPFPTTLFQSDHWKLRKTLRMHYGYNTTIAEYQNEGDQPISLKLTVLIDKRDHHHLLQEQSVPFVDISTKMKNRIVCSDAEGKPFVYIRYSKGSFEEHKAWHKQLVYAMETERGLDDQEDVYCIGNIHCTLDKGEKIVLVFTDLEEELEGDTEAWKQQELQRLQILRQGASSDFEADLWVSADQFIVWRSSSSGQTIMAGYHWFTDWGRDTMIALRGLILATGKRSTAKSILSTFLYYLDEGMIPNRFPDSGEQPEYNTIDASLWLFVAVYEYVRIFNDKEFAAFAFDKLESIILAHENGTRYNIHMTREWLLAGGEEGVQLTWMDAKVNGHVVTPRIGCPVEINALWYNAHCILHHLGTMLNRDVNAIALKSLLIKESFRRWFYEDGRLFDVVMPGQWVDASIRPNQIYAVSLPFSPLEKEESRLVLETVSRHLYTPYGLRSLSPTDPEFKPVFTGDPWNRDHAYHQGTVWSFLWGEYMLAYLNVHDYSSESIKWVRSETEKLQFHFYHEAGLHCISENFDGLNPNAGKGCIQQAWSVGMLLWVMYLIENERVVYNH